MSGQSETQHRKSAKETWQNHKICGFSRNKKRSPLDQRNKVTLFEIYLYFREDLTHRCVADIYFLLFRFLHISKSTLHPQWNRRKKLSYKNSTSIQRLERSDDMTSWWCWWWKEKGTREWKDKNQIFFSSSSYLRRLLSLILTLPADVVVTMVREEINMKKLNYIARMMAYPFTSLYSLPFNEGSPSHSTSSFASHVHDNWRKISRLFNLFNTRLISDHIIHNELKSHKK